MTINVISDVHASLDPYDGFKVIYARPQVHSREVCIKILEAAKKFASSDRPNKDFKKEYSDSERWIYKRAPHNHDEYVALIDSVLKKLNAWDGLSVAEKSEAVDEVEGIEHWHYLLGESKWYNDFLDGKNDLSDVSGWMRKTYSTFDPAKLEPADYLVICGDLGVQPTEPKILADIKEKTAGKFKDVFYIAGNHSHWWHKIPGISEDMPESIDLTFDYFEKEVPGDWLFLGCTMWTPIKKGSNAEWRVGRLMNDYRNIPGKFHPEDSSKQFEIQSTWLKSKIAANKDKKIVVFTHHQPFPECIKDDYKHNDPWSSDNVAEAYAVMDGALDNINELGNIKVWCCGHTHQPFDEVVHGVRVVRNPIGYSDFYGGWFGSSECDVKNWYNKVIDLGK